MILPDDVGTNGHLPLPTVELGVEFFLETALSGFNFAEFSLSEKSEKLGTG